MPNSYDSKTIVNALYAQYPKTAPLAAATAIVGEDAQVVFADAGFGHMFEVAPDRVFTLAPFLPMGKGEMSAASHNALIRGKIAEFKTAWKAGEKPEQSTMGGRDVTGRANEKPIKIRVILCPFVVGDDDFFLAGLMQETGSEDADKLVDEGTKEFESVFANPENIPEKAQEARAWFSFAVDVHTFLVRSVYHGWPIAGFLSFITELMVAGAIGLAVWSVFVGDSHTDIRIDRDPTLSPTPQQDERLRP
ncbi:MAG: hypothetical protein ACRC2U_09265 [Aeromonas sp.]